MTVIDGAGSRTVTFFRARRGVLEQIFRYSDPCGATHRSPRAVKLLSHVARDAAVDLRAFGVSQTTCR